MMALFFKITKGIVLWTIVVLAGLALTRCAVGQVKDSFQTPTSVFINEQEAIDIAVENCSIFRLQAQEDPYNIRAELTTFHRAQQLLSSNNLSSSRSPESMIWLVAMDGTWLLCGPPPTEGETPVPLPTLHHCSVIIDASTGELVELTSMRPDNWESD